MRMVSSVHSSGRVFATITSLAFAELTTTDPSYSAGTPILACTLATCAGIWQAFGFDITISGTNKLPFFTKPYDAAFIIKVASLNGA